MSAVLSRWRAQFSESETTQGDSAGPWLSKLLVGRTAAALFVLCGASSLASLVQPTTSGGQPSGAYVAVALAAGAGLLTWCLPWSRWPRWASAFLIPVGFALVAVSSALAGSDAVVYSVLFVLLFAWIGVAFPQGTALLALSPFAAAYVLPLVSLGQLSGTAVGSALYVGVACLLVGETLALLSTTLRLNQVALWRARAAVNDIGAELASTADPETLWSSIALRLSDLVDLPDSDVYRLMDDGRLVVLASVYDEKPCPEQLHVCTARDVWGVDREALSTREPVFIASPADPRLSAAEREDMHRWREQAMLIVPLVARDEVIGLVEISETREGRTITPEQIATVVAVCRLIAMALHDADTMHAQEARARRLASLFESSRAVASAATMEEALAVVARCAGEVFGVSECVAYEHDPDRDAVVARAMWERTPSGWDRLGEPSQLAEDPMSRGVLESGQPFLGLLSDPHLDPVSRADLEQWGEQSCLTVPMQSVDGPMGLLNLWDKEQERTYTRGRDGAGDRAGRAGRRGGAQRQAAAPPAQPQRERLADRARQPPQAPRGPRSRAGAGRALRQPLQPGDARHRRVQAAQRHARSSRRRHRPAPGGHAAQRADASRRRRRPLRRRRVPAGAARDLGRRGRPARGEAARGARARHPT